MVSSGTPPTESSPAECQQYCNSVPGTICCIWYLDLTINSVTDPCLAYSDPSCIEDWEPLDAIDAGALDGGGGFVWAAECQ
jgi:hypothetical protein